MYSSHVLMDLPIIRFYYEIKMKKISRSKQEEDKILKKL